MQVKNALPGIGADVKHGAITAVQAAFAGQSRRTQVQLTKQLAISGTGLGQAGEMLLGHQQNMRRRAGLDILEGEDAVVLKDAPGRDFSRHDAAEEAIGHAASDRARPDAQSAWFR